MVGPQGSNGGPLIYPQVACILGCLIGSCLINNYPYENHVSTGGTSSSCWECNLIMGVMTHYLFVLYYVPLSSNLTIEIFQECWTNAETTKQRAVNDTFYLICIHIFPLGSLTRHALFDASWIDGLMCLVWVSCWWCCYVCDVGRRCFEPLLDWQLDLHYSDIAATIMEIDAKFWW